MTDLDLMTDDRPTDLTDDQIAAFLRDNPDFFVRNPDMCDVLHVPKATSGKGIVDFQHFLVERLKADKTAINAQQKEIIESVRANMNNQTRIHKAVLVLLEARSFEEFIHNILTDLTAILNVDITALAIEASQGEIPHVQHGIRLLPEGTLDTWLKGKEVLLENNIAGLEEVYGGGAGLVSSQALVRINISLDTPPALLAFGSRNSKSFMPGQGTEQIIFLAHVVERCFRSWLDLPQ